MFYDEKLYPRASDYLMLKGQANISHWAKFAPCRRSLLLLSIDDADCKKAPNLEVNKGERG